MSVNQEATIHVIFCLVRGVLLWNVWEQVDAARKPIAEAGPFRADDLRGRLPTYSSLWMKSDPWQKDTTKRLTMKRSAPVIFTVGHSTRSFEELVEILRAHGVERLVDVRTIPRSRHNPQFNRETLSKALHNQHFSYRHMEALGGLRHPSPDSINTGWRNASFRGYADYMQTPAFGKALERLVELATQKPTAILCAEAVPWRCHRSLIADALTARGYEVRDIMSVASAKPHILKPMASVHGQQVTYPGGECS